MHLFYIQIGNRTFWIVVINDQTHWSFWSVTLSITFLIEYIDLFEQCTDQYPYLKDRSLYFKDHHDQELNKYAFVFHLNRSSIFMDRCDQRLKTHGSLWSITSTIKDIDLFDQCNDQYSYLKDQSLCCKYHSDQELKKYIIVFFLLKSLTDLSESLWSTIKHIDCKQKNQWINLFHQLINQSLAYFKDCRNQEFKWISLISN